MKKKANGQQQTGADGRQPEAIDLEDAQLSIREAETKGNMQSAIDSLEAVIAKIEEQIRDADDPAEKQRLKEQLLSLVLSGGKNPPKM